MFCSNCGKGINDNSTKYCPECGYSIRKEVVEIDNCVQYEIIKEKQEDETANKLLKIAVGLGGYGIIHAVVSSFIGGMSGLDLRIAAFFIIGAIICFVISKIIQKDIPLTDHYKFKCPRCGEENTIAADTDTSFSCTKCEKKMIIVNQEIQTID